MFKVETSDNRTLNFETVEDTARFVTDNQMELNWMTVYCGDKYFDFDDCGIEYSYESNLEDVLSIM
jgi:hypothetical protein